MKKIHGNWIDRMADKKYRRAEVIINGMRTSVFSDGTFYTVNDPSTHLRTACKIWGIAVCESLHPDDFKMRIDSNPDTREGKALMAALKNAFPEISAIR